MFLGSLLETIDQFLIELLNQNLCHRLLQFIDKRLLLRERFF